MKSRGYPQLPPTPSQTTAFCLAVFRLLLAGKPVDLKQVRRHYKSLERLDKEMSRDAQDCARLQEAKDYMQACKRSARRFLMALEESYTGLKP